MSMRQPEEDPPVRTMSDWDYAMGMICKVIMEMDEEREAEGKTTISENLAKILPVDPPEENP